MKRLFIALCLIFALTACGTVTPEKIDTLNMDQSKQTEKQKPQEFKVGEAVKMGNAQIIVNSAKTTKGEGFEIAEDGKKYAIVNMTIENIGNEALNSSTMLQMKLQDEDAYTYNVTIYTKTQGTLDSEIQPGNKIRGEVAFKVPENVKAAKFIYEAGFLQSGQAIFNIELE